MSRFGPTLLLPLALAVSAAGMETLHTGAGAALTARAEPSEAHPRRYRPALVVVPADIEAPYIGFDYVRRFAEPANRGKVVVKVTVDRDTDGDGTADATQRFTLRCSVTLSGGFETPFCTEWRQVEPLRAGDLVDFSFQFKKMPRSPTGGRVEFFGWVLDRQDAP